MLFKVKQRKWKSDKKWRETKGWNESVQYEVSTQNPMQKNLYSGNPVGGAKHTKRNPLKITFSSILSDILELFCFHF